LQSVGSQIIEVGCPMGIILPTVITVGIDSSSVPSTSSDKTSNSGGQLGSENWEKI